MHSGVEDDVVLPGHPVRKVAHLSDLALLPTLF